jgi:hypothetical protein
MGERSSWTQARTIDTDWEWRNPQDVDLEEHRPRRSQPATRRPSKRRPRPPLLPTLTLLAAGAAAALSVIDLVIHDAGNGPTQVIVSPPAENTAPPADSNTVDTRRPAQNNPHGPTIGQPVTDAKDRPQYNPYEPPIGQSAPTVDDCGNVPLIRGRHVPC